MVDRRRKIDYSVKRTFVRMTEPDMYQEREVCYDDRD